MKRRRTVLMFEDVDSYIVAIRRMSKSGEAPEWLYDFMDGFEHNYSKCVTYSTILRAIVRRSMALDEKEGQR